jgi:hypothetical protein
MTLDTNKEQVAKEGGVQPLLEMLLSTNPKMIEEALSTLRNLAVNGTFIYYTDIQY